MEGFYRGDVLEHSSKGEVTRWREEKRKRKICMNKKKIYAKKKIFIAHSGNIRGAQYS